MKPVPKVSAKRVAYIEVVNSKPWTSIGSGAERFQQFYPLPDSLLTTSLTAGGKDAVFGTDFIAPLNAKRNRKFKVKETGIGYGIDDKLYSDYTNVNVKAKWLCSCWVNPRKSGKFLISGATRGSEWSFPGISKETGYGRGQRRCWRTGHQPATGIIQPACG